MFLLFKKNKIKINEQKILYIKNTKNKKNKMFDKMFDKNLMNEFKWQNNCKTEIFFSLAILKNLIKIK